MKEYIICISLPEDVAQQLKRVAEAMNALGSTIRAVDRREGIARQCQAKA